MSPLNNFLRLFDVSALPISPFCRFFLSSLAAPALLPPISLLLEPLKPNTCPPPPIVVLSLASASSGKNNSISPCWSQIRRKRTLSAREVGKGIMASKTQTKDIITIKGSAAIVSEFFSYAANSILYNRGVYPEESFTKVKKYGLPMLLTQDEGVKSFLANLASQLSEWLEAGKLQRVVLVIMSKATSEVLERWNFNIETDAEVVEQGVSREKSDKEIMREIQVIMRQIASCVTYLPCLDEPCVFDVLAYTDMDVAVPFTWIESDAKLIDNPQMVKLHSFDTKIHKVDTLVSYKNDEWDQ